MLFPGGKEQLSRRQRRAKWVRIKNREISAAKFCLFLAFPFQPGENVDIAVCECDILSRRPLASPPLVVCKFAPK